MQVGSTLLLLAFLAQAGEGLMPLLCPPGMESPSPAVWVGHGLDTEPHDPHAVEPGHDHEEPCPFGGGSSAVCGASATAPSEALPARDLIASLGQLAPAEPADLWGALLPSGTFRPPRA